MEHEGTFIQILLLTANDPVFDGVDPIRALMTAMIPSTARAYKIRLNTLTGRVTDPDQRPRFERISNALEPSDAEATNGTAD